MLADPWIVFVPGLAARIDPVSGETSQQAAAEGSNAGPPPAVDVYTQSDC